MHHVSHIFVLIFIKYFRDREFSTISQCPEMKEWSCASTAPYVFMTAIPETCFYAFQDLSHSEKLVSWKRQRKAAHPHRICEATRTWWKRMFPPCRVQHLQMLSGENSAELMESSSKPVISDWGDNNIVLRSCWNSGIFICFNQLVCALVPNILWN